MAAGLRREHGAESVPDIEITMAIKKEAPVRLTGGTGFSFADNVAASFLVAMLSGQPVAAMEGRVERLDWEARDGDWLLDDLVVRLARRSGPGSLALSIKSSRVVTRGGFPAEFVEAAWALWLHSQSDAFEEHRDLLGLATGELAASVKEAWDDLLTQAIHGDPSRLAARFSTKRQTGETGRALFASVQCPSRLASLGPSDRPAAVRLLRHLRLLPCDLRSPVSRDRRREQEICRTLVESGLQSQGERLWRALVAIAKEHRDTGGSLDLPTLLVRLGSDFALKDYPDHAADWRRLDDHSRALHHRVKDVVAGRITVVRKELFDEVEQALSPEVLVYLLGESGSGKSGLAKRVAERSSRTLWFDAETLEVATLAELEGKLRLHHPLRTLLAANPSRDPVLVLDGVERFSPRALCCAAELIGVVAAGPRGRVWRVLVTAQLGREEGLQRALADAESTMAAIGVPIDRLAREELQELLSAHPELRKAAAHPELRELLRNLKILDWIATDLFKSPQLDTSAWVSLSRLADHLWSRWTGTGPDRHARSGLLTKLARIEAEDLVTGVGLSQLDLPEQVAIGSLEDLLRVQEGRVSFQHDLTGDWARVRLLVEGAPHGPARLVAPAAWPAWHPALRLYGQRVLEEEGPEAWLVLYEALGETSDRPTMVRDLLLESVIFAQRADLLDRLWLVLAAGGGALLKRLLVRFLHVATFPVAVPVQSSEGQPAVPAARMRVPYGQLWPPVLHVLAHHQQELQALASRETAQVCTLWLQFARPAWPARRDAAAIALTLARAVQWLDAEEATTFQDDSDVAVFESLLWAAAALPDEVAALGLELSRRRPDPPAVAARAAASRHERERRRTAAAHPWPEAARAAFPDRPSGRVNPAFRRAAWNGQPLVPLMAKRPEAAREIILACCLEPPGFDFDFGLGSSNLGVEHPPDHAPVMYGQGPFLPFLQTDPAHGIDCLVRLVNQATNEWARQPRPPGAVATATGEVPPQGVRTGPPGELVEWWGDREVYGWYRERLVASKILVTALMALEKWLYDVLDAGHDLRPHVDQILRQSRSVALLGVLVAVARRKPDLLAGPLQPLLRIWQIYGWDDRIILNDPWQIGFFQWHRYGPQAVEVAHAWHTLPHRKVSLFELVKRLLFASEAVAAALAAARLEWAGALATLPGQDAEDLELLCAALDPANYHPHRLDEQRLELRFEWPAALAERTRQKQNRSAAEMRQVTLPIRCRQLLDAGAPLAPEEAEQLWTILQEVASEELSGEVEQIAWRRPDALIAGIAVLLILAADWLAQHPEREEWCARQSCEIFEDTPPDRSLDSDIGRHGFLAEIAVTLLAQEPTDELAHLLVARAALGCGPDAAGLLMRRAFLLRDALGEEFGRLQNLIVLYAALPRLTRYAGTAPATRNLLASWALRLENRFIRRLLPAAPIPWRRVEQLGRAVRRRLERRLRREASENAVASGREPGQQAGDLGARDGRDAAVRAARARRRQRRRPPRPATCVDLSLLQHAFDWLPSPSQARDDGERSSWIAIHHGLLDVGLGVVRDGDGEEDAGEPVIAPASSRADYDFWLAGRLAALLPQLTTAAERRSFWQPILDLALTGLRFVDRFLDRLLTDGPAAASSPANFVECWREMIDYALASPTWSEHEHLDDPWSHLLGLTSASPFLATEENAAELSQLLPLYERWAERHLSSASAVRALAVFLQRPAARAFRGPGILWLQRPVQRLAESAWAHNGLDDRLAALLQLCWAESQAALVGQPAVGAAFQELLGGLVARGSAAALELRDRVNSSRSTARASLTH